MNGNGHENITEHMAVVNHEEQYSIWPAGLRLLPGWRDASRHGSKRESLDYTKEV